MPSQPACAGHANEAKGEREREREREKRRYARRPAEDTLVPQRTVAQPESGARPEASPPTAGSAASLTEGFAREG